jgi:gluconolactonase
VWFGDFRSLVFSDIPNNRMLRYCEVTDKVTLFRLPANYSNGNTRDRQGRLITCEHLTRRITRTEHDGSLTVLLDRFDGKPLNAPNDLVVHSDGAVWFTDPGYGILVLYEGERAEAELPTRVYRLDTVTGVATVVADDLVKPNGLCFSPDESRLYISDSGISHDPDGPGHIRVFEVVEGRKLRGGRVFADMSPGFADGIRTDRDGNLWSSAGWAGPGTDSVHCLSPDGELIGRILLPEPCSNLCFGGAKRNRLFMTCSQSLYSLYVEAVGN